ncbi:hypothetical protein [Kordia zhangzhouensis]|uniref:hypothetical protein n=1 Tax=Kordia zhangzhouensis TaxID=1620405 RepID=UPI0006295896|nr:hypothetical protein [Kordia zhangzhouensis]
MITLKDYIGKIYKEVTNAKVQSDIETLAIAQEYVENPLLRHFSVPNIRIKDLELTIPVAIDTTKTVVQHYKETEIQKVYEDAFFKVTTDFYPNQPEDQKAYFDGIKPELSSKSQQQSIEAAANLQQADPTTENYASEVKIAATRFAETSYSFLGDYVIEQETFKQAIVQEIENNLQPKPPVIEELPVIVETRALKEISDPASMVNIKINITDDAMEWTTDIDEEGNTVRVLNYE